MYLGVCDPGNAVSTVKWERRPGLHIGKPVLSVIDRDKGVQMDSLLYAVGPVKFLSTDPL